MAKRVLVTGAGGFVGHHLVRFLVGRGEWVRGVDTAPPSYEPSLANEFVALDLLKWDNCVEAVRDVQEVYHLAADMGGIEFITAYHAQVARNNVLMNTHMLEASRLQRIERFFFSSSACIYPGYRQDTADIVALKEDEAYPAQPEDGYGWEKLFAEKLCLYYWQDFGLETRVARFHNVYGPSGTYQGGREKAPAAICRKVALAPDGGEIEVFGDGQQTRSFMYIDDCIQGIDRLMHCDYREPVNVGSEDLVTVDELVDMVCRISGKSLRKQHNLSKPQGVRGRNSDNELIRKVLDWEPSVPLETGLTTTYRWIEGELEKLGRIPSYV